MTVYHCYTVNHFLLYNKCNIQYFLTSIINTPYNIKHVFDLIKKKNRHWYHTHITNYKVYTKYLKLITIKPLEIENKPFNSFILVQLKKSGRGVWFSAFLCNVYFTKLRWISISMVKGFRFIEHLCSIVNRVCEKAYLLRKKNQDIINIDQDNLDTFWDLKWF